MELKVIADAAGAPGGGCSFEPGSLLTALGVYWIGALDPGLRTFVIILCAANGTTYNSDLVRGEEGVAVIDTVKAEFAEDFFARLESVARCDGVRVIVLNHLDPDYTGALPELMRRAPRAQLYISKRAIPMIKALLKPRNERAGLHDCGNGRRGLARRSDAALSDRVHRCDDARLADDQRGRSQADLGSALLARRDRPERQARCRIRVSTAAARVTAVPEGVQGTLAPRLTGRRVRQLPGSPEWTARVA